MAKRVLAIGLGGSGKAALTMLKERLEETYGEVPDSVVLLSLDTDSLRETDRFAGTSLDPAFGERGRIPECQLIVSPGGLTMDTVFADIRSGRTSAFMNWLEHEKLDRMLGPAERDIRGGAQQRRPIGRTALFLRYAYPVYASIKDAIGRMYGDLENDRSQAVRNEDIEKEKRLIFIVSSVAGGTGSGMLLDVANLVRAAINSNQNWQKVSISAIIVLPDAFATYTRLMDDPTNLKPNSYAALRELDRFMRVHSALLPYMIRYADSEQSITWCTNQLVDHVYLVDTANRSARPDFDLGGDPMKGVFPVIADFMMAHVDNSLGDALAIFRSNAGMSYEKANGQVYSGFNVMSYIFPIKDIIESFSYRFAHELLVREFLPVSDEKRRGQLNLEAEVEVERVFTTSTVLNRANLAIIQKSIAAMRRVDPEVMDMSWAGLLRLISLSNSGFAEDYQFLRQSLDYLQGSLALTKDGDYRRENFEDGATRLLNFTEQFLDDYLGSQLDQDDSESRIGGDWDVILGRYRDALRVQFAEALDVALLDALNRCDERKGLLPNRLPYARMMLSALKNHLTKFKVRLENNWHESEVETQLRQSGEGVRNALTWMNDTRHKRFLPLLMTEPRRAQDSFRREFVDYVSLSLHQRVYRTVLDVLDSLGAAEKDASGQKSILDMAILELESWENTLQEVDCIITERWRQHEADRSEKKTIKVRDYLSDSQFEEYLYRKPEHFGVVAAHTLGQVNDQKGLLWIRIDEMEPLDYKLFSTWSEQASGAEQIARTWFAGIKDLFQVVRKNVTVAERLVNEFPSPTSFINRVFQVQEPFLRYNPSLNIFIPFQERYISFNWDKSRNDGARQFLGEARATLRDQGLLVDVAAESTVACTVVEIVRGLRLDAVESFRQCAPEYRAKLSKGYESIHLFPEEQNAADWEKAIPTLGEAENRERELAPELVIAMGDPAKLRAFTMACAYGLVYEDSYFDPETGQESTELWLKLSEERRVVLSQSGIVRKLDPTFANLPASEQSARLQVNALQSFILKLVERPGFDLNLAYRVKHDLSNRGVPWQGIEIPFTLNLSDVNAAINDLIQTLQSPRDEVSSPGQRRAGNVMQRLEILDSYLGKRVQSFKHSAAPPVRDMGTVMHLLLREERARIAALAGGSFSFVLQAWDKVYDQLSDARKKRQAAGEMEGPLNEPGVRAALDRLLANLGSALNFTPTTVDFAMPIPSAIVDLSSGLPSLMPGSDNYTGRVPLAFFLAEDVRELLSSTKLSSTLNSLSVPAGRLVIVFPFVEDSFLHSHRAALTSAAPHQLARTVVLLGRSDLIRILTSNEPLREFRNVILEQIEILYIAPYQDGGAVREHGFFGREFELGTIAQYARERSFLIIGGRRIGKSSLLHRLSQITLPQAGLTTLLLDCQGFDSADAFLREPLQAWWPGPPNGAPTIGADLLDYPLTATPLVVLVDEADKLARLDRKTGWAICRRLRALSQRPGSRIQFVLAGERTLDEAVREDAGGPLFNFGTRILLGCLEFRAVEGLVLQPMRQMGVVFDDELRIIRMIFDFTSGHPNIVQRICLRLLKMESVRFSHRISVGDVRTISDDAGFQRDFLNVLWENSTRLEQIISLVMADQPEANTLSLVLEAVLRRCGIAPSATQVAAALRHLVELRSILKQLPDRYVFAIEAFPRVVANTGVLKEHLRVLAEQFKEGEE